MPEDQITPTEPTPVDSAPAQPAPEDTLGDAGKAAIAAERKARKEAEKTVKDLSERLKAIEDKDKSELEKAQAAATELQEKYRTELAARLRLSAAATHGIPAEYHDLLTATDEEALQAQATKVAALLKANGTSVPRGLPGQGHQQAAPTSGADAGRAEALRRFGPPPAQRAQS